MVMASKVGAEAGIAPFVGDAFFVVDIAEMSTTPPSHACQPLTAHVTSRARRARNASPKN
jgi:hypothetical protein